MRVGGCPRESWPGQDTASPVRGGRLAPPSADQILNGRHDPFRWPSCGMTLTSPVPTSPMDSVQVANEQPPGALWTTHPGGRPLYSHMGPIRVRIAKIWITHRKLITIRRIVVVCVKRGGPMQAFNVQKICFREEHLSLQVRACGLSCFRPNSLIDFVTLYWVRNSHLCRINRIMLSTISSFFDFSHRTRLKSF